MSAPWSTHCATVLHILRYLKGILFNGLDYLLSLFVFSMHSLILIGQEIPLIEDQTLVIVFFLVFLWSLGEARNKPLWHALALKQNIVSLLIPHLKSFGFDGFSRIQLCPHPLPLLFIVITGASFILLSIISSTNGQNTSRLIVISSVIILFVMLSSWFQFPLKINLQISSLSQIIRNVFVLWLTNSSWSLPRTLSLRGVVNRYMYIETSALGLL